MAGKIAYKAIKIHMLNIRPLQPFEAAELAPLAQHIFLDTFLPVNNPEDVISYAKDHLNASVLAQELRNPSVFTYGVFWNQELIGYMQMLINQNEIYEGIDLELKRFYLLPQHHGRGIAKSMMDVCEQQARDLGRKAFWLGVWEKNYKAQRFYEKCGFKKIASHPFVMGQETQTDFIFAKNV
jgi:diamine N-acetyltransferase